MAKPPIFHVGQRVRLINKELHEGIRGIGGSGIGKIIPPVPKTSLGTKFMVEFEDGNYAVGGQYDCFGRGTPQYLDISDIAPVVDSENEKAASEEKLTA